MREMSFLSGLSALDRAIICLTSSRALSVALSVSSSLVRAVGSSCILSLTSSMLLNMTVRMLLRSWPIPPAMSSMALTLLARAICCLTLSFSESSLMTATAPMVVPSALMGATVPERAIRVPSGRMR